MRIDREKLVDGRTVEVLVPETAADLEELARREAAGELDSRLSFADERRHRRGRRGRRRHRPSS